MSSFLSNIKGSNDSNQKKQNHRFKREKEIEIKCLPKRLHCSIILRASSAVVEANPTNCFPRKIKRQQKGTLRQSEGTECSWL